MMRLALGFILWASLFAPGVYAQQIPVRTGEHGEFTRVVFDVQPGTSWKMSQDEDTILMALEGHRSGFSTAGAFQRIDQRRVSGIETTASEARIKMSCDCTATAFAVGARMVVIDIAGAPSETPAPALPVLRSEVRPALRFGATAEIGDAAAPPLEAAVAAAPPEAPSLPDPATAAVAPPEAAPAARVDRSVIDETTASLGLPAVAAPEGGAEEGALAGLQQQISREVASAASRGILKPTSDQLRLPESMPKPAAAPSAGADPARFPQAELPLLEEGQNLRVTTTMDFQGASLSPALISSPWGPGCVPPSAVAITEWADDTPMATQIALARGQLYGEFDQLDHDAAVTLSRVYLHFGFGPEAMRLLALDAELQAAHGILLEMGEILEFGRVREPRVLKAFLECDSALALWAILSVQSVPTTTAINTKAALLALNALPKHLREFIAPELSRKLLEYGDASAAKTALRSIKRVAGTVSDDTKIALADIELAEGHIEEAQDKFSEVVSSNSEQSAEALIKFVATQIEQNEKISADTALLVDAYAKELRDDPLGHDLRETRVLALIHSGQFEPALDTLRTLPDEHGADARAELLDQNVHMLEKQADDATFLSVMYDLDAKEEAALTGPTVVAAANRLFALGFDAAADRLIETADGFAAQPDVRILKSKIALSMRKPALAEAHLLGIEGAEADGLRAQARHMIGDHLSASDLYSAAGDHTAADTSAFLSTEWKERTREDVQLIGPLAELTNTELSADPTRTGMLARTEDALKESAKARAFIDSLLIAPLDDG